MNDQDNPYPQEIKALELEIHSTRNAIWNAMRQGRTVPPRTTNNLKRLEKRLQDMKALFWIVTLKAWLKAI